MKTKILMSIAITAIIVLAVTFIIYITLPSSAFAELTLDLDKPAENGNPKNIILFIGDGMGFNHVLASSYYEYGDSGKMSWDNFPIQLAASTYPAMTGGHSDDAEWTSSYDPALAWTNFEYLREKPTDSGASGTALCTGVKTYNGAISVDINGANLVTILEHAKELGKSTGVLTSVVFNHATPASFATHNENRGNYGELAHTMLLESKLDLIIGTGHPYYNNSGIPVDTPDFRYLGDSLLWKGLQSGATVFTFNGEENKVEDSNDDGKPDAWKLLDKKEDLTSFGSKSSVKRVFGLLPVFATLQEGRAGDKEAGPFEVPQNENVPSLVALTKETLSFLAGNDKGFVVMIEGGAIDWAAHDNSAGRLLEEMHDFNNSVAAAIEWVENESSWNETLIIVTADHETGFIWGEDSEGDVFSPIINKGKGNVPGISWYSSGHTNSLVPVYGKGCGSEIIMTYADEIDPVRGRYITNSEIAQIIFRLLNQ